MSVFSVNMPDVVLESHHVTVAVPDIEPGMVIVVTEFEYYRDETTDILYTEESSWQGQVSDMSGHYRAPSEMTAYFYDGVPVWLLKDSRVPLVMGPVNRHGMF